MGLRSCSSTGCFTCAAIVLLNAILCMIGGEVILPILGITALKDTLVFDTAEKSNKGRGKPAAIAHEFPSFNVTNAYQLQTATPAPKPIIQVRSCRAHDLCARSICARCGCFCLCSLPPPPTRRAHAAGRLPGCMAI